MKLTFLGATHEVTGSCYLLEACGKNILIDCGMEQGVDVFENKPLPLPASQVDMVLLTHAHMDHSGKLPLLCKEGFQGQIFATGGTAALGRIMLLDSAHIQEFEAEWRNRKAMRAGRELEEPLYTTADAEAAIRCFVEVPYGRETMIAEGIRVRFIDAGHLLGSASIEVWVRENDVEKKLIFSGDIGNTGQPLINDPTLPEEADYVIMESTYGDRSHEKPADYAAALAEVMQTTFDQGGNVVIPSFAIGRTQEMLYFIRQIIDQKMISGHDGFEVYVDSPLAVEATGIFQERMYSDFDDEAKALLASGVNPIGFAGLRTSVTSEESKRINDDTRPKVIISASGMCDAGRIKHHLKHNLWREESTILFVGYQAEGTLGRLLLEGAEEVKLFGEEIEVRARVLQLPGVSGHADNAGLMRWIGALKNRPQKVFVTHGDDEVCVIFRDRLRNELGLDADAPYSGTRFDLAAGVYEVEAQPVPIRKETSGAEEKGRAAGERETAAEAAGRERSEKKGKKKEKKVSTVQARAGKPGIVFTGLLDAGLRLMELIRARENAGAQEMADMAMEIEALIEKWKK